jgi:gliding motility-associated-like protein
MKYLQKIIWLFCLLGSMQLVAQVATDCVNAIPICSNTPTNGGTQGYGVDDFNGAETSGCLEQTISGVIESNSAWYRFRTGATGELGFNIGFDTSEDWDFALYRSSDCNNLGEPVRCNFFDNRDEEAYMGVGEDPTGNTSTFLYEDWLQVEPGQDYYLLINNFSNTNSGFSIQFSGQIFVTNPYDALDCSIVNNLLGPPRAVCDNENVVLDATTTDAISYTWYADTGMGYQPIPGETSASLTVTSSAIYRVEVITMSMNNIISDVQIAFTTSPITQPLSHISICSDLMSFDLSQKDMEALGSQDSNEFIVSYHDNLTDAQDGSNVLPNIYTVTPGLHTIYVRTSAVANPNCFDASQEFQLTVVESPELNFETEIFICENATAITIGELHPNAQYSYNWDSGETSASISVSQPGTYTLTATNVFMGETCSTSRTVVVVVSETPRITEVLIEDISDNNTVEIITDIEGDFEYQLDNGAFQTSNIFSNVSPGLHTVTINDLNGCGAVSENITVVGFPKFFTPNGDGSNDRWHIVGVSTLVEPIVHVYDRYGKLLKQLDNNSLGWDGTFNGRNLPSSDYWFKLTYMDTDGERIEAKYVDSHFSLKR